MFTIDDISAQAEEATSKAAQESLDMGLEIVYYDDKKGVYCKESKERGVIEIEFNQAGQIEEKGPVQYGN